MHGACEFFHMITNTQAILFKLNQVPYSTTSIELEWQATAEESILEINYSEAIMFCFHYQFDHTKRSIIFLQCTMKQKLAIVILSIGVNLLTIQDHMRDCDT